MKFANLVLDVNSSMVNLGDWIQIFAIENLYNYMGIDYADVVRIKVSELSEYEGEDVILPINYPFYGFYNLSTKIYPVYLGISLINIAVADGLHMKQFQPIGCRDYHTLMECKKAGLDSYYGGCLSISFPKRKSNHLKRKVYMVDVSEKIQEQIPKIIKQDAIIRHQVIYNNDKIDEQYVKEYYEELYDNASLVITSKIHCAQPCLAVGIPVVFICEHKSFRFDVLSNYIPIYELDQMSEINWSPEIPDLELLKHSMLENAKSRVWECYSKYSNRLCIHDFYLQGQHKGYCIDTVWAFQKYIEDRWSREDHFSYILWGVTQIAESIYEWISRYYKNANLAGVIDIYNKQAFHGCEATGTDILENTTSVVLVTAGAAGVMARKVFETMKIKHYVICYNGLHIVDGIEKDY